MVTSSAAEAEGITITDAAIATAASAAKLFFFMVFLSKGQIATKVAIWCEGKNTRVGQSKIGQKGR